MRPSRGWRAASRRSWRCCRRPYREALTLTELEGLTQREAAEMLGISLSGMKSRVQRGRAQLRRALEVCCDIDVDVRGRVIGYTPRPDGTLPGGAQTRQFLPRDRLDGRCSGAAPARLAPTRACWRAEDVADPRTWTYELGAEARAALGDLVASVADRPLAAIDRATLPTDGPLVHATRPWRAALRDGLGFVRVRGLDVDAMTEDELVRAYLLLGLHLGTPVSQNLRGELLTHVRDTGADPRLASTRLYTTRAEQDFPPTAPTSSACCVAGRRTAAAPVSSPARRRSSPNSSTRPQLYAALFTEFPWRYEESGIAPIVLSRPICSTPSVGEDGARVNTFFIPWYIRGAQALPDAPRLTADQLAAIEAIEQLAHDPRFHVDMTLVPGDLQWVKNAAILHRRTAYEDHDAPDRKRHLLRLWLSAPDFDDGDTRLRAGITAENVR
ncbi:MAG: TauD/TfdA family dioxygenase [Deltaproteobacteria bacterium]|nr:TauD/TfdA family dioxygenase [Deltaproteobacteria bacterium]